MYQVRSCHSGTAQRAGPGYHEHLLCQCFRRPLFLASGLCPRPGMTRFLNFLTATFAGMTNDGLIWPGIPGRNDRLGTSLSYPRQSCAEALPIQREGA
jgi:hypothetical protein